MPILFPRNRRRRHRLPALPSGPRVLSTILRENCGAGKKNIGSFLNAAKSNPEAAKTDEIELSQSIIKNVCFALGLSVFLAFSLYRLSWTLATNSIEDKILNFLSGFAPFFAALWLGRYSPRISRLAYAIIGVFAGFFGYIVMLLVFATNNQGKLNPDPIILFFTYTLTGIAGFLGAGFLGERLGGYGPVAIGNETSGNVSTYNVESTTFVMTGDHWGGFAGYTNSNSPIQLGVYGTAGGRGGGFYANIVPSNGCHN
jgi:hypothetical protein